MFKIQLTINNIRYSSFVVNPTNVCDRKTCISCEIVRNDRKIYNAQTKIWNAERLYGSYTYNNNKISVMQCNTSKQMQL